MKNQTLLKNVVIIVTAMIFTTPATADEVFNGSTNFGYAHQDLGTEGESISTTVGGTLYASPLAKKHHPWLEASFLERKSYFYYELDQEDSDYSNSRFKTADFGFNMGAVIASKDNPWFAAFSYRSFEMERRSAQLFNTNTSTQVNAYFATAGYYVQHNTRIGLGYSKRDTKYLFSIGRSVTASTKQSLIFVRSLIRGSDNKAIGVYSSLISSEQLRAGSVYDLYDANFSSAYYFNQRNRISGGVRIIRADLQSSEGKVVDVGYNSFVNNHLNFGISVSRFFADTHDEPDNDAYNLRLSWWF